MPPDGGAYARPGEDLSWVGMAAVGSTYDVYLGTDYPSVRDRRADVPTALAAVVEQAMATDPSRRYQTARDMEQALGALE